MVTIKNDINDTIGATNTGVTNTLTVDNASDTASSSALINVTVGGTSAGDAFETFTVAGTTNWSIGTDNSVTGDPFVIAASTALGTTNVMSALTTGEINYPLQPAFFTKLSANPQDATGDGTAYTVAYDSEIFDQGGDLSGTTFTAPITGRYQLDCMVSAQDYTSAMTTRLDYISTSNRNYQYLIRNPYAIMSVGTVQVAQNGACLADMDAADTAVVIFQVSGGTKTVDMNSATYFDGKLIC